MNAISPQSGISLVDSTIVLLIIGILVTIAIPQFSKAQIQFTRQNVSQELKFFLDRARFDSVKRHAKSTDQMASVKLNDATSFTLSSDLNSDGTLQPEEVRQISFNGKSNIKIVGDGLVFPVIIRFNNRGQAIATDGNNSQISPNLIICEQNCTPQTANIENSNTITISKSGTSSINFGNFTPPNITSPNASNIKTDNKINKSITVSNSVFLD